MSHGLRQFVLGKIEDWGQVPAALGMTVDDNGLLRGTWNDRVSLRGLHSYRRIYARPDASEFEYQYYTELYAILDPPLRVGVRLDKTTLAQRVRTDVFGANDTELGHADFDRAFGVSVRDRELLIRMLPTLEANALVAYAANAPLFWVSDRYVTIEHSGYERDLDTCRRALESVGRAGQMLLDARARETPAWEPAFHASWAAVAAGWGLEYDARRMRIEGAVRGVHMVASISDDGGHTTLAVTSSAPWGCSLSLGVQGGSGFFAKLWRGQDIVIGDAAFDDAFVVKGEPEARVRELLTSDARRAILEAFKNYADVEISEDQVRLAIRRRLEDPREFDDALKRCFRVAETLAPGSGSPGPYRGR